MSIIVVDGPEKAGKSSTIERLVHHIRRLKVTRAVDVVKQSGRAKPDDSVYMERLIDATTAPTSEYIAVWDRGWPSEYVYGLLLGQERRLALDPWLGEWLHGRAVKANGLGVILLGESSEQLAQCRSSDDLPVDPAAERRLFENYALRYGWVVFDRNSDSPDQLALRILNRFMHYIYPTIGDRLSVPYPPVYAGPRTATTLVVGEQRSDMSMPGGWLPFSSRLTTMLGRAMGDRAFEVGWINAADCPVQFMGSFRVVVTCGKIAADWFRSHGSVDQTHYEVDHPAHTFRFNNQLTHSRRVKTMQTIRQTIKEMQDGNTQDS